MSERTDLLALSSGLGFSVLLACAPPPVELPPPATPPPVVAQTPADTADLPEPPRERTVQTPGELRVPASWTMHAPLPQRRTEVSVTTDGERIFLAGGFGPPEGQQRATAPRSLWAYTPAQDNWASIGTIPGGVHHAALVHHEGRLYLIGGFRETTFEPVADVHVYDLATGEWSEGAPMPTPRGAAGFTVLDGRIHVIGGNISAEHEHEPEPGVRQTEDRSVNIHEAYDPASDSWATLAPMPTPRNHLGAAALGGRIHAVAGRADGNFTMTTHEVYEPSTNAWRQAAPVPTGRSGIAVVAHQGQLYVFGGETFGENQRTFADAERYDPATDRWEVLPPMPTARHGLGAAAHGAWIYVISGGPQPGFSFGDMNERLEVGR